MCMYVYISNPQIANQESGILEIFGYSIFFWRFGVFWVFDPLWLHAACSRGHLFFPKFFLLRPLSKSGS